MAREAAADAEPGAVERLANWALSIREEDIPAAAATRAKLLLLDTIGCGYAGIAEHAARGVVEATREAGGAPRCAVIGERWRTGLANAVFANGVLIRALDLNDYTVAAKGVIGGHPSDNIPVALCAAEAANAGGRALLAAIVVGYEVSQRLRAAMDRGSQWDGVTVSGAVAPVMAGRLLGLDNRQLAHALALSLARAATPAIVRSGHISAAKSIANALVAQSGVQAVELARHGVTGPLAVMEHKRGLGGVFPNAAALAALDAPLGALPYVTNAHVKAYPCLATGQSIVAAGLALRRALGGDISGVERVRVILGENATTRDQAFDAGRVDPRSREAADHSFNFLAAVSLLDGEFGLAQFDNERWFNPEVRGVMAKLDIGLDQGLADRARGPYPCAMEAALADGSTQRVEMLAPPGYSAEGLDEGVVIDKFNALTRDCLGAEAREKLVAAALGLDTAPSCAALFAALKPRKDAR